MTACADNPLDIPPFLRREPSGNLPAPKSGRARFTMPKKARNRLWMIRDFGGSANQKIVQGRVIAKTRAAALQRAREKWPRLTQLTAERVS